jgi:hypothetical protein
MFEYRYRAEVLQLNVANTGFGFLEQLAIQYMAGDKDEI